MASGAEPGESTSLLCDPGCSQTLTLPAMNFSEPAVGTGTLPRSSEKHRLLLRLCHCSQDGGHSVWGVLEDVSQGAICIIQMRNTEYGMSSPSEHPFCNFSVSPWEQSGGCAVDGSCTHTAKLFPLAPLR